MLSPRRLNMDYNDFQVSGQKLDFGRVQVERGGHFPSTTGTDANSPLEIGNSS